MSNEIKVVRRFKISPICLYPTENLASIESQLVAKCREAYKDGMAQSQDVVVIQYGQEYYIYSGHEQVLAAIDCGENEIEVIEIDRMQLKYWSDEKKFIKTLQDVGMSSIYDFETLGGFTYKTYPKFYQNVSTK